MPKHICPDCKQPKKTAKSKRCRSCAGKHRKGKPYKVVSFTIEPEQATCNLAFKQKLPKNRLSKREVLHMAIELSGLAIDLCDFECLAFSPSVSDELNALRKYVKARAARYGRMLSFELAHEVNDATKTKAI